MPPYYNLITRADSQIRIDPFGLAFQNATANTIPACFRLTITRILYLRLSSVYAVTRTLCDEQPTGSAYLASGGGYLFSPLPFGRNSLCDPLLLRKVTSA
jgi:hypothetical protein